MKLRYILSVFLLGFFLVGVPVYAIDLGNDFVEKAGEKAGYEKDTSDITLAQNVGRVINIALSVVGVLFTVLMVYAGYLWMTARGADDQITKAKEIIVAAIIGIFITLGAYSISNFVVPRILEANTVEQATQTPPQP